MNHSLTLHKKLYALLKQADITNHRHEIVLSFTDNRTDNSAEMYTEEIISMIKHLEGIISKSVVRDFQHGDKMRKRILSLCHQYGWTTIKKGKEVVDYLALNAWMQKYSYLNKPLNKYAYSELPKLITQFERMVEGYLKSMQS